MIFNYLIFNLILMKSIFIQGCSPCGSTFKLSELQRVFLFEWFVKILLMDFEEIKKLDR